ncbi:hypothetical protein RB195_017526 [Necator americanus]
MKDHIDHFFRFCPSTRSFLCAKLLPEDTKTLDESGRSSSAAVVRRRRGGETNPCTAAAIVQHSFNAPLFFSIVLY